MRKLVAFAIVLAPFLVHASGPNVLDNSNHTAGYIQIVINALGGTGIEDYACTGLLSTCDTAPSVFVPAPFFPNYAVQLQGGGGTNYPYPTQFLIPGTNTLRYSPPYVVLSQSSIGYSMSYDQTLYTQLVANSMVYNFAYCPLIPLSSNAYPPIEMFNIQLDFEGECSYGPGIEFSAPQGGLIGDTTSSGTAAFSGMLSVLKENHPTWTWNDIKGALRQTASSWSTGWVQCVICGAGPDDPAHSSTLGYGDINFTAAMAVASTAAIYLQPPGMTVDTSGNITLYPFLQTRRVREVVYLLNNAYVWPVKNEYTTADIAASGATLLYTSAGAATIETTTYRPSLPGVYTFLGFTTDGAGNYSRVESFTPLTMSLNTASCH